MNRSIHAKRPDLKHINIKALGRNLKRENRQYARFLVMIPREKWPDNLKGSKVTECWRSNSFLLQVHPEKNGIERLSIMRTRLLSSGEFDDGISWDELQRLKSECGRGEKEAIEIFPPDKDIVNVANMRHLWILTEPLDFTWRKS